MRIIETRVIIMSIGSLIRFILSILIYRINYPNTVGFSCQFFFSFEESCCFFRSSTIFTNHSTIAGSWWLKKELVAVSSAVIFAISSSLSAKSKTFRFSAMRSLWVDFGITTIPLCRCQRNIT